MKKIVAILILLYAIKCIRSSAQAQNAKPDLQITYLTIQDSVIFNTGGTLITIAVSNRTLATADTSSLRIYLSKDSIADNSDIIVWNKYTVGSLNPYVPTRIIDTAFGIPSGVTPGNYYLIVVADIFNTVNESNENNNQRAIAVRIIKTPIVDITVSMPDSTLTGYAAENIPVYSYITDLNATYNATVERRAYFSKDTIPDTLDDFLQIKSILETIKPSQTLAVLDTIQLPAVPAGDYFILFEIINLSDFPEKHDTSFVYEKIHLLRRGVDLVVNSPVLNHDTISATDSLMVSNNITNLGAETSLPTYTGYYITTDSVNTQNNIGGGTLYTPAIPSRGSYHQSFKIAIPSSYNDTIDVKLYVYFVADATQLIAETDETNNVDILPIIVIPSTLNIAIITDSLSQTTIAAGNFIESSLGIHVSGTGAFSKLEVAYLLSTDSLASDNDFVILKDTLFNSIKKETTSIRNAALSIDPSTSPGKYYIIFYADLNGVYTEANRDDNIKVIPITIVAAVEDIAAVSASLTSRFTAPGDSLGSLFEIKNTGNIPVLNFGLFYFLSSDSLYSVDDVLLGNLSVDALAAGSSQTYKTELYIPSSVDTGNYFVIFYADYGDGDDVNIHNNLLYQPIKITIRIILSNIAGIDNTPQMTVAPNPVGEQINIFLSGISSAESVNLLLYRAGDGIELYNQNAMATNGRLVIPAAQLKEGLYILRIKSSGQDRSLLISKQ